MGSVGVGTSAKSKEHIGSILCYQTPPCYYDQPQDLTGYFNGDKIVKLTTYGDDSANIVTAISESGKVYYWGWEVTGKRVGDTILQLRIKAYQVPTSSVSVVVSPLEVVSPIVKIPFTAYLAEG